MLDKKYARIRELLDLKEKVDAELAELTGGAATPEPKKRGRPKGNGAAEPKPDENQTALEM